MAAPLDSVLLYSEKRSTHPQHGITHPAEFIHLQQPCLFASQPKRRKHVSTDEIRSIAARKFEKSFEGITYLDLCGEYKVVGTEQQARELLHYHKKKGTLFTNSHFTIPQQYFCTADQAETARSIQEYRSRTIPVDPTGVSSLQSRLSRRKRTGRIKAFAASSQYDKSVDDIEQLKTRNFYETMEFYYKLIADSVNGGNGGGGSRESAGQGFRDIRVGLHKILIHLEVYRGREEEAYEERLYDVAPHPNNNKAKILETDVEISNRVYHIKAAVFPSGKIIVDVPCSDNPFPIWLQDHQKTNRDFLCLLVNIRYFLQDKLKDAHSRFIPPTHNPCWRLKNCDINFDIPTTAINLFAFPDMQVKQFFNVAVSRIYAKMLNAQPYIRIEKACKNFDMPITDDLGLKIIDQALDKT
jgi:hypothetical protein